MANVKNININNTDYNIVDAKSAHKIQMDVNNPKTLLIKNYVGTTLGYVDLPTGASIVQGTWTNKSDNVYTSFTHGAAAAGDIISIAPGDPNTYARIEYASIGNIGDRIDLGGGSYYNRTELYDTQRINYLIKVTNTSFKYLDITDRGRSPFIGINSISSIDDAIAKLIRVLGKAAYLQKDSSSENSAINLYDSNDQLLVPAATAIVYGCDGLAYNIQYFSSAVTMAYAKSLPNFPSAIQGLCSNWSNLFTQSLGSVIPGIYTSDFKYTPIYTPTASNCVIAVYRYIV